MKFLPGSGGSFSDSFTITNPNPPTPTVTLSPTPTMTPSPSPTSPPSPTPVPGAIPVNKLWYFAEGRVGGGFKEYLTLANPTNNDCHVNIRYLYIPDGGTPQTKTLALDVSPNRRVTQAVNADLNVANTQRTVLSNITFATSCGRQALACRPFADMVS
jgi:hypothetical protein